MHIEKKINISVSVKTHEILPHRLVPDVQHSLKFQNKLTKTLTASTACGGEPFLDNDWYNNA